MFTNEITMNVIMFSEMDTLFKEWLEGELKKKNWSQSDLARAAKVSRATISNLLNDVRNPGPELLSKVANALDYSDIHVFRKAGILDPVPETTELAELAAALFSKFPDDEKEELLTYMQLKLEILRKQGKIS